MSTLPRITFFVDVDNTLLDNDGAKREMDHRMDALIGPDGSARFWQLYEEVRGERSMVDIPTTLARFLAERDDRDLGFAMSDLYLKFPFTDFLFPQTLHTIQHLRTMGTVAILSDGDPVYQVAKITRSGLGTAVDGFLLVFPHKEQHLPEITAAFAADHYVLIDDKPTVIEKVAQRMHNPLTTVFVRQGRYASTIPLGPWHGAGLTVDSIGDLRVFDRTYFIESGRGEGFGYLNEQPD